MPVIWIGGAVFLLLVSRTLLPVIAIPWRPSRGWRNKQSVNAPVPDCRPWLSLERAKSSDCPDWRRNHPFHHRGVGSRSRFPLTPARIRAVRLKINNARVIIATLGSPIEASSLVSPTFKHRSHHTLSLAESFPRARAHKAVQNRHFYLSSAISSRFFIVLPPHSIFTSSLTLNSNGVGIRGQK